MKKHFLKAALVSAILIAFLFVFAGCSFQDIFRTSLDEYGYNYTSFTDSRESVTEGYFRLTIHTDKDEFAKGEAIGCWAEIEYIGDQPGITVYSWGSPIQMEMIGGDVDYNSSFALSPGAQGDMTLEKGKPLRVYLSDALPKSSSVLPGRYEIDAWAGFNLSPDYAVSYNATVSAVIEVTE